MLQHAVGYRLPKEMHPEFGNIVKAASDAFGDELKEEQIVDLFNREYVEFDGKYKLASHRFMEQRDLDGTTHTRFEGRINVSGEMLNVVGVGNGPIDSFFQALEGIGVKGYEFVNYHEHAISRGSDAKGICYIELKIPNNGHIFGVGIDSNINVAHFWASFALSTGLNGNQLLDRSHFGGGFYLCFAQVRDDIAATFSSV